MTLAKSLILGSAAALVAVGVPTVPGEGEGPGRAGAGGDPAGRELLVPLEVAVAVGEPVPAGPPGHGVVAGERADAQLGDRER